MSPRWRRRLLIYGGAYAAAWVASVVYAWPSALVIMGAVATGLGLAWLVDEYDKRHSGERFR